ncbi:MAG: cell division topological specificity factor MinE [Neisseriaceae bacterium]|nr:cell division topological specificity factor MinE [Neisseriaceae bacterium]
MASILDRFFGKRQTSAGMARDRLQIVIAHERSGSKSTADYLPALQRELLEVLSKYVTITSDDIRITKEEQNGIDVLALNITLPENPTVVVDENNAKDKETTA